VSAIRKDRVAVPAVFDIKDNWMLVSVELDCCEGIVSVNHLKENNTTLFSVLVRDSSLLNNWWDYRFIISTTKKQRALVSESVRSQIQLPYMFVIYMKDNNLKNIYTKILAKRTRMQFYSLIFNLLWSWLWVKIPSVPLITFGFPWGD
jgi:hypothetical protein